MITCIDCRYNEDEKTANKIIAGIDHFLLNNNVQAKRVMYDMLETTMHSSNNYLFKKILNYGKAKLPEETNKFLYDNIEYIINHHLN